MWSGRFPICLYGFSRGLLKQNTVNTGGIFRFDMHDVIPPSNQCLLIVINQLPVLGACIFQLELWTVVGLKAPEAVEGTVQGIAEVGGAEPSSIRYKSA